MDVDDAGLAVRAAAGHRDAFVLLLDRYGGRVRAIALRMTAGDPSRADDLTQDLFLHLLRVLPRYDASRPFGPWLFRVAANLFRNRIRDERRRPHTSLDALGAQDDGTGGDAFELPGPPDDPAERAAARDEAARVRAARDALPASYRQILALHYEAGLSYEDVAEALGGIPVGTVKNRLHRARAALAARLGDAGGAGSGPPAGRTPAGHSVRPQGREDSR